MKALAAFLIVFFMICAAFNFHLDSAGNPVDIDKALSPVAKVVNNVSSSVLTFISKFIPNNVGISSEDPEFALYEPYLGQHDNVSVEIEYVELYLYSSEINVGGVYHTCYVLRADESKRGSIWGDRYLVVQDLDKTSDKNSLEGWCFINNVSLLLDSSDNVFFPIRSFHSLTLSDLTLADLTGEYWTPEGMVTNP